MGEPGAQRYVRGLWQRGTVRTWDRLRRLRHAERQPFLHPTAHATAAALAACLSARSAEPLLLPDELVLSGGRVRCVLCAASLPRDPVRQRHPPLVYGCQSRVRRGSSRAGGVGLLRAGHGKPGAPTAAAAFASGPLRLRGGLVEHNHN